MPRKVGTSDAIEAVLREWKASRLTNLPIGGLYARNPVAHKWKSPFRSMMIRECCFWRECDLMHQSYTLFSNQQQLGARILLRSGFETLAILIYLNMMTENVLNGRLDFHLWAENTSKLLIGTRDKESLMPQAINILTIFEKTDKKYPGIKELYRILSETAHPNYEGLLRGYANTRYEEFETDFSDRWMELYGDSHIDQMMLCITCFQYEYDEEWAKLFDELEAWITANDEMLEGSK
jgi:hypothetical protein